MANPAGAAQSAEVTASPEQNVVRPAFISEEVWRVVQLAAEQNNVEMRDYIEKALLDEAMILEQERFGRRWLVRNQQGDVGEVDFC